MCGHLLRGNREIREFSSNLQVKRNGQ
jgi:hypothetical protein